MTAALAMVCAGHMLSIRADSADSRTASNWLKRQASESGIPAEHFARLDHCLDEALANIIMHGGSGARAKPVMLQLDVRRDGGDCAARLTVSDAGMAFDPTTVAEKPRAASIEEAEPGGLGLVMMRANADELSYRRRDEHNHLTIAVRWREAG